ncbi:MAG: YkoP family protein [Acidobacteriota bacterium]
MGAGRSTFPVSHAQANALGQTWIRALVTGIDGRLRLHYGVREFSQSPDCIFRIQVVPAKTDITLSDGTRVRANDRIIDLHLWNEQIPLMPPGGPTLAWARQMNRAVDISLRELATLLKRRKDLDDVVAVRANMKLGCSGESDQVTRIAARFGFERIPQRAARMSLGQCLRRFGESILISMMVLARNPAAFRMRGLWRDSIVAFLSIRSLLHRYEMKS